MEGSIRTSSSVSLVAMTVDLPVSAFSVATPYLLLDDGSQFAITSSVPEPANWMLAAAGLLGLLAHRRLRRYG